jgi:acetyl-CoA C-acetyltransferase
MNSRPAYIVGSIRTPFVKSMTKYADITLQDLMTTTLQKLVDKIGLQGKLIGDVALGAVIKSSLDWNFGRECVLGTNLDPHTPGYTLQRACGTSLEAAWQIALKISHHQIDSGVAGGADTNSDLPLVLKRSLAQKLLESHQSKDFMTKLRIWATLRPSDFKPETPGIVEPRTYLSMGQHCEKMVQEWKISREAQDELALKSHQNGVDAYKEGFYADLVFDLWA